MRIGTAIRGSDVERLTGGTTVVAISWSVKTPLGLRRRVDESAAPAVGWFGSVWRDRRIREVAIFTQWSSDVATGVARVLVVSEPGRRWARLHPQPSWKRARDPKIGKPWRTSARKSVGSPWALERRPTCRERRRIGCDVGEAPEGCPSPGIAEADRSLSRCKPGRPCAVPGVSLDGAGRPGERGSPTLPISTWASEPRASDWDAENGYAVAPGGTNRLTLRWYALLDGLAGFDPLEAVQELRVFPA